MTDPVILTVDTQAEGIVKIRRINPFSVEGISPQPPPTQMPEEPTIGLVGLLQENIYYGELVE